MATWKDWNLNDVLWGIIVPVIVGFLIIIFPHELSKVFAELDPELTLNAIFVDGLAQAILTVGIPLFAGLIWNQWAGGATGFLLGSIYALYVNDTYAAYAFLNPGGAFNNMMMLAGSISILAYVVSAMLAGYMSGALNRGSMSFRRMLVAAMIAVLVASTFELWSGLLDGTMIGHTLDDVLEAAFFIYLPKIVYGIIMPLLVTVFGWFGISPKQLY